MSKQTVTEQVIARMKELRDQRSAELESIQAKQTEAQERLDAAEIAIHDATANTDLDGYKKAIAEKADAQVAIDMYAERYKQIRRQEYVSNEESDQVIDDLLKHEDQLTCDFEAAIAAPISELKRLSAEYQENIRNAEWTIVDWTRDIHKNYKDRFGGHIYKETGSNISPSPIPVRQKIYEGCEASKKIDTWIREQMRKYAP